MVKKVNIILGNDYFALLKAMLSADLKGSAWLPGGLCVMIF
jgi:hypothetical protein